jgi:DNA-binding NtrC family response regulator
MTAATAPTQRMSDLDFYAAKERVLRAFERNYIIDLLDRTAGNMSEAARIAAVDRSTLYRLMERHGIRQQRTIQADPTE